VGVDYNDMEELEKAVAAAVAERMMTTRHENDDNGQDWGALGARMERKWFYVTASVLSWIVFWDLADRHQDNALSRAVSWAAVAVAIWVAIHM